MASISKRRRKQLDGTYVERGWQVRWVDPDGAQRLKVFATRAKAYDYRTEIDHKTKTGAYIDPDDGKVTFKEYAEAWRKVQAQHRPGTEKSCESYLRLWVYPHIGHLPIGSIRRTQCKAVEKAATEKLAATSVGQVLAWMGAVFNGAVADRKIYVSPAVGIKGPDLDDKDPVVPLTHKQWTTFVAALPEQWRIAGLIGVGAGLRGGEVRGLTVDRIDFLRRELRVDRQVAFGRDGTLGFEPLKTKASRRTIPVSDTLLEALAAHIAKFPDPDKTRGLLLTSAIGRPMQRSTFSKMVAAAAGVAGFEEKQRFHALRHTYASALIRGGCSVKVVQARMGHATAQETLDTYGHMWPDDDDRTRAAIEAALSPPEADSGEAAAP